MRADGEPDLLMRRDTEGETVVVMLGMIVRLLLNDVVIVIVCERVDNTEREAPRDSVPVTETESRRVAVRDALSVGEGLLLTVTDTENVVDTVAMGVVDTLALSLPEDETNSVRVSAVVAVERRVADEQRVGESDGLPLCERVALLVTDTLFERALEDEPQWETVTVLDALGEGVPVTESYVVADEVWETLADAEPVALGDCDSESVVTMEELALEVALVNSLLDVVTEVLGRRVAEEHSVGECVEMALLVSVPLLVSEGEPVEAPEPDAPRVSVALTESVPVFESDALGVATRDALVAREGVTLAVCGATVGVVSTDPVAVVDALLERLPETVPELLVVRVAVAQCVSECVNAELFVNTALLRTVAVTTALGVSAVVLLSESDAESEGVVAKESDGECELDTVDPTEAVPAAAVTETDPVDIGDALDVRETVEDAVTLALDL